MLFFTERKASKELQASGLIICADGSGSVAAIKDGVHARGASRDPSTAAPILNIVPEGAHTARALRPQARVSQWHKTFCTASGGLCELCEHCNTFEPWVCASQQKNESPRQRLGDSFRRFLVGEKTTYPSP